MSADEKSTIFEQLPGYRQVCEKHAAAIRDLEMNGFDATKPEHKEMLLDFVVLPGFAEAQEKALDLVRKP